MQYRKLGSRIPIELSALGFGCMRFPTVGENKSIDRPAASRMLELALEGGVNYFDTAVPYHRTDSESFLGEFFSGRKRSDVHIASKMPVWELKVHEDLDRIFEGQRERLRTDCIEFYLMHALSAKRWDKINQLGTVEWAQEQKRKGRIKYLGFSFHDGYRAFVDIIDGFHDWDFCQIQYNYMNETTQAGTAGLAYATQKGIGVVVMEPLLGGALATPPQPVIDLFDRLDAHRSPAEHALRWLWDKPDIGVVLSGMSTLEQVEENIEIASRSPAGCVGSSEMTVYPLVRKIYDEMRSVPCTSCRYCMPCPHGVSIPEIFEIWNDLSMFGARDLADWRYNNELPEENRASACTECGECEPKCPQEIKIIDALKSVHRELANSSSS